MRIGLQLPWYDWSDDSRDIAPVLKRIAQAAEAAGFHSLWVMDHFFMIAFDSPPFPKPNSADDPMLECYTTLGYLAAVTERMQLGPMVVGAIYRHPGVLIKTATTLDVLSEGRSYFGIGAGWYEEEARGLGVPFPDMATRFQLLEETIEAAKLMWSNPRGTDPYNGTQVRLAEPINVPAPVQRPHPPILIGGGGERRTLRLVARYADACNLNMGPGPAYYERQREMIRHKLDVLRRHCDDVGRDYGTIEKTSLGTVHLSPGAMTASDVRAALAALADIGIDHAIVNMPNAEEITPIEMFGREIIPALAG